MQLAEITEWMLDHAKNVKEVMVETAGKPVDLMPIVVILRGDQPIADITIRKHERDHILHIAHIAIGTFDADVAAVAFEAYTMPGNAFRPPNINPLTGKTVRLGEMDDLVKQHDALAKGWVAEMVSVIVATRAGEAASLMVSFHWEDGKVVWDRRSEVFSTLDDARAGNSEMARALIHSMNIPAASTVFSRLGGDLERFDRNTRDITAVRFLQRDYEVAVALFADITDEARVEALKASGTVVGEI